jgi:2-hydroxy-3-keto-5-methylthiopentenyl-1-phosphate phosphatase
LDINQYVIVSDFDGTVTLEDSNAKLFEVLGDDKNAQIEVDFLAGLIGNRQAWIEHFQSARITIEEYYKVLDENVTLDEGFDDFLYHVKKNKLPLYILSAGFHQGISHVMGRERLENVEVIANEFVEKEHIYPKFATTDPVCKSIIGPCGNCKRGFVNELKEKSKKKIIYIGDGISDFCAAQNSDLLFAKDSLKTICDENQMPYIPFLGFDDVTRYLFTLRH